MLSSIIVCQTPPSPWPTSKMLTTPRGCLRKPRFATFSVPRVCTRSWVTVKAFLLPCRCVILVTIHDFVTRDKQHLIVHDCSTIGQGYCEKKGCRCKKRISRRSVPLILLVMSSFLFLFALCAPISLMRWKHSPNDIDSNKRDRYKYKYKRLWWDEMRKKSSQMASESICLPQINEAAFNLCKEPAGTFCLCALTFMFYVTSLLCTHLMTKSETRIARHLWRTTVPTE